LKADSQTVNSELAGKVSQQTFDNEVNVLNNKLAAKLPYSYGTATPTATDDGFLWYDENDTPPTPKFWDGAAFQALTSGKILQIVRATDSTARSTTSTSYVDVTGMSVTITPQKSNSAIIVAALVLTSVIHPSSSVTLDGYWSITDSSNNSLSGAEEVRIFAESNRVLDTFINTWGYSTPATTSATTYKLRFRAGSGLTARCRNNTATGQMFAIEVGA